MRRAPKFLALLVLAAALPVTARAAADADHAADVPLVLRPLGATASDSAAAFYALRVMDQNKMAMSITNYGFVGNNFTTRAPSMEYPLGTGYEHLVRGGLWVGAIAQSDTGTFTGVTTAAVDGSSGSASANATEFTPTSEGVTARSTLETSRFFDPAAAVSEFDMVSTYADGVAKRANGNAEDHRPLHLAVRQENYSWSFSNYANFVIFHYIIKNTGGPLRKVWVGLYNEMATGPKNLYSCWPPSGGCGPGSWFGRKYVGYVDSLNLFTERYCQNITRCNTQLAPPLVGVKLLGCTPGSIADTANTKITLSLWSYAPGSAARDEDVERYALMSAGTKTPLSPLPDSLSPPGGFDSGDPVELISVGPFQTLNPGDSITVDFAYIGAEDNTFNTNNTPAITAQMDRRAHVAQRAYDLHYKVPVPPPSPRMRAVPRHNGIDLYWENSPEAFLDPTSPNPKDFEGYRVYVGEDRNDVHLIGQFDLATAPNDTTGFNTGFGDITLATPVTIDGVTYRYHYAIENLRDGFQYFVSVTSYDVGTSEIESLESGISQNEQVVVPAPTNGEKVGSGVTVFPNPYRVEARWDVQKNVRDHYLWFANLPRQCTIRIYTLNGDLIYETQFDGATYDGSNARGIYDPRVDLKPRMSGAMFGWDMITRQGQAAATGLYMYSVEDKQSGKRTLGKFLIVKSDREGLN